jgi:hypothetical protein
MTLLLDRVSSKRGTGVAIAIAAAIIGVAADARATVCFTPPPCAAFREAAVVFVGTVRAVESLPDSE